jgi:hypothetical protein
VRAFPIAVTLVLVTFAGGGEPEVEALPAPAPPRVLVAGDETVREFAERLRHLLTAAGADEVEIEYALSAGLARPDLAGLDPDAVVLAYRAGEGPATRALRGKLEAEGRRVYWVRPGTPHAADQLYGQIARDFALPR